MAPLWETGWQFFKTLDRATTAQQVHRHLGKENRVHRKAYACMFMAAPVETT